MNWKIFLILSLSQSVNADILFVDVNNNPQEIKAAKAAAQIRKEKLILFPSGSEKVSKESLKSFLGGLKNTNVTSMVISGHDGNGNFSGRNGGVQASELKEILKSQTNLGISVRSLYLWGCYTATPGSLEFNWKDAFPNLQFVAGFDGAAPLGDKPAGQMYLKDALTKEKSLIAARDEKELGSLFKQIRGRAMVNAAVCSGDSFASNKKISSLKKLKEECRAEDNSKGMEVFECYAMAKVGCENPPSNTGNSPLRNYYNFLQETSHCEPMYAQIGAYRPTRDQVIRLIYYKNVVANFSRLHGEVVTEIDGALKRVNAPDDLLLGDINQLSRRELAEKIAKIEEFKYKKGLTNPLLITATDSDIDKRYAADEIESGLRSMRYLTSDIGSVPFEWVEPGANRTMYISKTSPKEYSQASYFYTAAQAYLQTDGIKIPDTDPRAVKIKRLQERTSRNPEDQTIWDEYDKIQEELRYSDSEKQAVISKLPANVNPQIKNSLIRLIDSGAHVNVSGLETLIW